LARGGLTVNCSLISARLGRISFRFDISSSLKRVANELVFGGLRRFAVKYVGF
jgi:hypothetical protein